MTSKRNTASTQSLCLAVGVWVAWLVTMTMGDYWHHFREFWNVTVTMIFGSFIAGATSEGGGAVAFPVLTLALKIKPHIARDFSLMIQSVGMIAAAFAIWRQRIVIESRVVIFGSIGGAFGVILGIEYVSPALPPAFVKMLFVSFWSAFGLALYIINRDRNRNTYQQLAHFGTFTSIQIATLGVVGGVVSGLTGSGLDITLFSILVLGYNLDERVATPTSVVLMGLNAAVGFAWKASFSAYPIAPTSWHMWLCAVPVVVIGAPLGARFIATKQRSLIVGFLLMSISVQTISAFLIVPLTGKLFLFSSAVFLVGISLFSCVAVIGRRNSRRRAKTPIG